MFTLYSAEVTGNPGNCSYPHKHVILDEASLKAAICHDYVCAEYKNSYRNGENFIGSDCLPVDCDNDHSEKPEDWITPDDVMQAFPGVTFAIHYSRFHNREKNGKPARPKFHVLFPIEYVTDAALYSDMKKLVNSIFPYFDTQALDAARFFFGTTAAEVALYPGRMNLTEYLDEDIFDEDMAQGQYDNEFTTRIRCEHCGSTFRRNTQSSKSANGGKMHYWRCPTSGACVTTGIREDRLKELTATVMGLAEHDAEAFKAQIEYISVAAGMVLTFHFFDGREESVQYNTKRQGTAWTPERREKFKASMQGKYTEERRKAMSEHMKKVRSEKHWASKRK